MKKILSLALVGMLSLALAAPVYAGRGHGGGFHGGSRGGFHHGGGFHAEPAYQAQTQVTVAPSVQREVCYSNGCYHLYGDGVTAAYQWVWVPTAPPPPPGPPNR